jgi:hypothetical protein
MRNLLALFATAVAVGCGHSTAPSDALDVTVASAPDRMNVAGVIDIEVRIHNGTDDTLRLGLDQCVPPFQILEAAGKVIGPGPRFCTLELKAPVSIGPGETILYASKWYGDSDTPTTALTPVPVPPGQYLIRPRVFVIEGGTALGKPKAITIVP